MYYQNVAQTMQESLGFRIDLGSVTYCIYVLLQCLECYKVG